MVTRTKKGTLGAKGTLLRMRIAEIAARRRGWVLYRVMYRVVAVCVVSSLARMQCPGREWKWLTQVSDY